MANLANLESSYHLDDEVLKRNTRNVIVLFQHWGLKNEEECNLFGISGRDTIERVGNLLGIHKNLRILYPYNREVVYQWIKGRNQTLHNLSPLDTMLEYGYIGIAQIRRFTDHIRGQ